MCQCVKIEPPGIQAIESPNLGDAWSETMRGLIYSRSAASFGVNLERLWVLGTNGNKPKRLMIGVEYFNITTEIINHINH